MQYRVVKLDLLTLFMTLKIHSKSQVNNCTGLRDIELNENLRHFRSKKNNITLSKCYKSFAT